MAKNKKDKWEFRGEHGGFFRRKDKTPSSNTNGKGDHRGQWLASEAFRDNYDAIFRNKQHKVKDVINDSTDDNGTTEPDKGD